jgi:hypothetical protein
MIGRSGRKAFALSKSSSPVIPGMLMSKRIRISEVPSASAIRCNAAGADWAIPSQIGRIEGRAEIADETAPPYRARRRRSPCPLHFSYGRLRWICQFELNRGLAKNTNDSRFLAALLHSIIVWRVRNAAYEFARGHRHSPLRLEILARIHPRGAENDKAQPIGDICVRRAHVTRMPLDQYNVRSGLVGCAEHLDRFD